MISRDLFQPKRFCGSEFPWKAGLQPWVFWEAERAIVTFMKMGVEEWTRGVGKNKERARQKNKGLHKTERMTTGIEVGRERISNQEEGLKGWERGA